MRGLLLLFQLLAQSPDTLVPRPVARAPAAGEAPDSARLGPPQVRLHTAQGSAAIWVLRATDSVYVVAAIQDSTPSSADALVISLNTGGATGGARDSRLGHSDFQWMFQRTLDSSVVYRGRNGRWEPPRNDPDWRLGRERSGGGWTVTSTDQPWGWSLVLRLDPAWLDGIGTSRPAIAFRVSDDRPRGWDSWPAPPAGRRALVVEENPSLWVPVGR